MQAVYKFIVDFRAGTLEGIFLADPVKVEMLLKIGFNVHFGEVLGKHSDVVYRPTEEDIKIVFSHDKKVIDSFRKHGLSTGINPFDYRALNVDYESLGIEESEDEDETLDELIDRILSNSKK
jgi:hypothetical protein